MADTPVTLTIPYPNEKQRLFLESKKKYIAFGGARGGGKAGPSAPRPSCWRSTTPASGC